MYPGSDFSECVQQAQILKSALSAPAHSEGTKTLTFQNVCSALQLRKLEILGSLQQLLTVATDCSFLLNSRGLLPLFLGDMRAVWPRTRQLPHLLAAVADAGDGLRPVSEGGALGEEARGAFRDFVVGVLEDEIIAPLCQQIETDLRIHIHSNQIAQVCVCCVCV